MNRKDQTNEVRQILMNELGLTRERVRGIIDDIVQETISKHTRHLIESGQIEKQIQTHIERSLTSIGYNRQSMRATIADAAAKEVKQHMMSTLPDVLLVSAADKSRLEQPLLDKLRESLQFIERQSHQLDVANEAVGLLKELDEYEQTL